MCVSSHSKRPHSTGNDSLSSGPVKSPRRDDTDLVRASPYLTTSDLDGIRTLHLEVTGVDVYADADVEFDRRCGSLEGIRSSAVVAFVRLARNVSKEHDWREGSFDWHNVDVMDYVSPNEYLDARRSSIFPVEGQVGRVVIEGKSWMTAYGALNMRMAQ